MVSSIPRPKPRFNRLSQASLLQLVAVGNRRTTKTAENFVKIDLLLQE